MNDQKTLLRIVQKWKINLNPEYRGFRCADCQRYLRKAFHHHLKAGGFDTPVHFCNQCQKKSNLGGGVLKTFTCDKCGRSMHKSFHVWKKDRGILKESHFCKSCWLRTQGVPL